MMMAVTMAGCGGRSSARVAPEDPIGSVPVAPLPTAGFAGGPTLLLTVGGLIIGDSASPLPDLEARRTALLEAAYTALDTALRRDARDVHWMGLGEQRRVARRAPTLTLEPDRLTTAYLVGRTVQGVPDPLWAELRTLAGLTGARMAVAPAAARITGRPGAYIVSYVLVVVDTRVGQVVWRSRSTGSPAATPEAAFASAALAALVPLH
ncbi:MAG: hypothetical protein A3I79_00060 [Gemmatimonadetes bacterium RIFCSPLOWO2_02_FULL_71_11]|nr:MAG: hypothetical protein A3I79_00060 [Gemmatimonadetes bacterium RIFCSPLOWO2_02_FULL_71_11]